jgi:hypothetical protein
MSSMSPLATMLKRKNFSNSNDVDDNYQAQKRYFSERMATEIGILKLNDTPKVSARTLPYVDLSERLNWRFCRNIVAA